MLTFLLGLLFCFVPGDECCVGVDVGVCVVSAFVFALFVMMRVVCVFMLVFALSFGFALLLVVILVVVLVCVYMCVIVCVCLCFICIIAVGVGAGIYVCMFIMISVLTLVLIFWCCVCDDVFFLLFFRVAVDVCVYVGCVALFDGVFGVVAVVVFGVDIYVGVIVGVCMLSLPCYCIRRSLFC